MRKNSKFFVDVDVDVGVVVGDYFIDCTHDI